VQWVGEEVKDIRPGEWVFAATSKVDLGPVKMGGHVSPAITPMESIWKIPKGVDPIAVSGLVLVQVGYNCAARPPVQRGDVAVVIGDGLVGQWAAQVLAHRGAEVILVGRHDPRLQRLKVAGGISINGGKEDPVSKVRNLISPQGIAVLVDTVGSVSTMESFHPLMRHNGHMISAGFCGTRGLIDIQMLRKGELTLHCPSGWERDRMDRTLELITGGVIDTMSLITHNFPAGEAERAWDLILNRKEDFLGVILEWK
jgi:3-hydroxyethyl bacteriochlorophyllide a dehydrogenase